MAFVDRNRTKLGRFRNRLAVFVGAFVIISSVPVASARATIWLLWSALLAAVAILVIIRSWQIHNTWVPRFLSERWLTLLFLVVPVWATLQFLSPNVTTLDLRALTLPPEASLSGILRHVSYLMLAAIALEIATSRNRVFTVGMIVFLGIAAQAVWALTALKLLGDIAIFGEKTSYLGFATGTFINRNSLATYLGIGLVLGVGLLYEKHASNSIRETKRSALATFSDLSSVLICIGCVFIGLALVMTQSRLGATSTVFGLTVTVLLMRMRYGLSPLRVLFECFLLCVGLGALVAVLGAEGVSNRFLFTALDGENRLALYSQTLAMIAERPWTGYGMDAFGASFEAFRGPPLNSSAFYDLAHNTYLTLWSEFGVLAGSAPILGMLLLFLKLFKRSDPQQTLPGMSAAACGAIVLAGIHSLGDFSLEIPANAYLFVVVICLGLGRPALPHQAKARRKLGEDAMPVQDRA